MNKTKIQRDIAGAKRVGKFGYDPYNKNNIYNKYGKIYYSNNERINFYHDKFNYDGSILCVASSGDHMLHSLLNGSKDITLFDVNRLTKYYCMLKLAGVKTLSYEEFFKYFSIEKLNIKNKKLYTKVRNALSPEDRYFWDEIIKEGLSLNNFYNDSNLSIHKNNAYHNKEFYYVLKEIVSGPNSIKFIESDVFELSNKLDKDKKFSSIFLSNISDYVEVDKLKKLLEEDLKKFLIKDGLIQTKYYADYDGMKMIDYEDTVIIKKDNKKKKNV